MQYLKDDVSNRILSAALAEFKAWGFRDASMRRIAKSAGVTPGNLYHYHAGKQALFDALVGPVYDSLTSSLAEVRKIGSREALDYVFRQESAPLDLFGINAMIGTLLTICKTHNTELLILLVKSEGAVNKYTHMKSDVIALLDEILRDKMLPNIRESGAEIRNSYITYVLAVSFIEGLCAVLVKYEDGDEVGILMKQLIDIFFQDIAARF